MTVYPDPPEAPTPDDVLGYWVVWKEMKTNKITKVSEHTITHVGKDGPEMNTGVVHSVKIYWTKKGVDYDHKALKTLKEPGVTEHSASK